MFHSSHTDKRVAFYLKQMKKAMPKIKREIKVYQEAVKTGTVIQSPKPAPQFNHG